MSERCLTCRPIQVHDNIDCPCSCGGFCECHDPQPAAETAARIGPGHNHANDGYHADCGWCARGFTSREIPLADPAPAEAHEGEIETLSAVLHAVYQKEAHRRGDVRHSDVYGELSESTKEWDRVLARFVLERERRAVEAARAAGYKQGKEEK